MCWTQGLECQCPILAQIERSKHNTTWSLHDPFQIWFSCNCIIKTSPHRDSNLLFKLFTVYTWPRLGLNMRLIFIEVYVWDLCRVHWALFRLQMYHASLKWRNASFMRQCVIKVCYNKAKLQSKRLKSNASHLLQRHYSCAKHTVITFCNTLM